MEQHETKLRSYVIDHDGDPEIVDGKLVWGVQDCMGSMRSWVHKGDWLIGTLGKKFPSSKRESDFVKSKGDNYWKYLVYAMRVTGEERDNMLSSTDFYCFFQKPVLIPPKFQKDLIQKKQRGLKCIKDKRKINSFEKWIRQKGKEDISRTSKKKKKAKCKSDLRW